MTSGVTAPLGFRAAAVAARLKPGRPDLALVVADARCAAAGLKGVADTIKLSGLNVPILVQAYPDDLSAFNVERRRDAFCGKLSVCNNLRQYGFPYTLTELHTVRPLSDSFRADLKAFAGVCHVVNGPRNARLGAIGARPRPLTLCAIAKNCSRPTGSASQRLTCPKSWARPKS